MKRLLILVSICMASVCKAQSNDSESLLQKEWKIDLIAMNAVFAKMIEANPSTASLDDLNKQVAIETAMERVADMKVFYKSDNNLLVTRSKQDSSTGKWEISDDQKEITHITDDNGLTKKYTIVELTDSNLQLLTDTNINLIFIANK